MKTAAIRAVVTAMLFALGASVAIPQHASAKEYLLVGAKPNSLFLIDTQARKVARQYQIPKDGPPFSIVVSPDNRIAYVLTGHSAAVSGIDLDSGKEVFRAELSLPQELTRSIGGMALSRDGKELFVEESVTRLLKNEYQVQPCRVAVYRTDAGLDAKPARSFKTPRRVAALLPSTDGKILYALGWDLYAFDLVNGKLLKTQKFFHWDRPNSSPPDLLNFWPLYERSEIYAAPYFYTRTDLPADNPAASKTGVLLFNLRTGKLDVVDFENTSAAIFSTVVNPKNTSQVMGVYTTLSRIDVGSNPKLDGRITLDHSYYAINISDDGSECYLGGTMSDIAVYSTAGMKKLADIPLAGGGDMGLSMMRVIHRD